MTGTDRRLLLPVLSLAVLLTAAGHVCAAPPAIGDYDAEPRRADGHVDSDLLVKQLQVMGANTYYWLVWHAATDWEDLPEFLPKAKQAGISVWVYLVPHSESSAPYPYCEPFRHDYVRWAEEIAKLSLQHDNLPGYIIDDFVANISPGASLRTTSRGWSRRARPSTRSSSSTPCSTSPRLTGGW